METRSFDETYMRLSPHDPPLLLPRGSPMSHKRPVPLRQLPLRLEDREIAAIDRARGSESRAAWMRRTLVDAATEATMDLSLRKREPGRAGPTP